MRSNVITIARTLGAGGEDLGESLADALGYRYVDAEILDRAAALAGVTPAEVGRVEERKTVLGRILEHLPGARRSDAKPQTGLIGILGYEQLIVDVIKETADMQFVVIVAHGAAIPLAGREGLLRVMVTASAETRIARVAEASGATPYEARIQVEESDRARADYFRRFFALDRELPTHYDLVVNTDALTIEQAAKAVLALAA
jgi:cytidylate kinase